MMPITFKYRDREYKLKESTLALKQASVPLMYKFAPLKARHLDTIDLSAYRYYQDIILDAKESIEQLEALEPTGIYEGEQTNAQKIEELKKRITDTEEQFQYDSMAQIALSEYQNMDKFILRDIALDVELMEDIFSKILEGEPGDIDFEADEYENFAMEVLVSFFSKLPLSKKGLRL